MSATGVHKAVVDGDMELVEELILSGRSRADDRGPGDMTPVHYAVQYDRDDIVRLLLTHGANPNLRNSSGLSALHMASALSSSDMVWLLLDWGADPSILDSRRMTPKQCNVVHDAKVEHLLRAAEGTSECLFRFSRSCLCPSLLCLETTSTLYSETTTSSLRCGNENMTWSLCTQ